MMINNNIWVQQERMQIFSKKRIEPYVCLLFSFLTVLVLFHESFGTLWQKWMTSGTYAHGFLIPIVSLYLIWLKKDEVASLTVKPTAWGLLPIVACILLWQAGKFAYVLIVQQLSVVTLLIALVYLFLGRKIFQSLWFPLAYLYFCIPFGNFLIEPLQNLTAFITVKALMLSGISVYAEGWNITTSRGSFEVAAACSGIRYLIASIALGIIFAHFAYRTFWRKTLFIGLCIVIPLVGNGIRAYGIIVLAHFTHMKLAIGFDHLIYGWLFFGLIMLSLFWLGNKLRSETEVEVNVPLKKICNESSNAEDSLVVSIDAIKSWILVLGFVGLLAINHSFWGNLNIAPIQQKAFSFELSSADWHPIEKKSIEWLPVFPGADERVLSHFVGRENKEIDLFYARFLSEAEGKELIASNNYFFDSGVWRLAAHKTTQMQFSGKSIRCTEYDIFNRFDRRLIWVWYRVNGIDTHSPIITKILIVFFKLLGNLQPPMVIAVSSGYQYYPEQARAELKEFSTAVNLNIDHG
uniref:Transmembrane exosortase EpsH n=2 Tax=Candidatus Berkiella cookevillensis TaxID=437022 RepID=A0A0Q9YLZ5_9GAMM